jgi:outer membrane lipoprotein-sorting protein
MKRCLLLVLLCTCQVLPAAAAELALPELMRTLSGVAAAEATFVETRQLAMLDAPLVLKGRLSYTRPDRIEKHVLSPHDELTRIVGDTVTIENRARKRVTTLSLAATPAAQAFAESLRATLAGDLAALQHHYTVQLRGQSNDWTLALAPRASPLASLVREIRIRGAHARLLSVQVEETGGDSSLMTITPVAP